MTGLWRVSVRATGDEAEPRRAELLALSPAGIEELPLPDGDLELAAYVGVAERDALLAGLVGAAAAPVEQGWENGWRAFHRPVEAGGLWLGPPWEQAPDPSTTVVIDPGRAFGTGAHPTTRLCVELLATTAARGSLLDVGCGSGVLAIAAARLDFAPVFAVDDDPVAVETTRVNAAANGVELEVRLADALVADLPATDVAIANVLLGPVERLLVRLDCAVAITSGYLGSDRLAHDGWTHHVRVERDGWAADRFVRAERAR